MKRDRNQTLGPESSSPILHWGVHALIVALFLFFVRGLINYWYPLIGHDYEYFIPRLVEGADFLLKNVAVQDYTRFCAGTPAFANPLSMQFSVGQVLTMFFDPWSAVQLTIAIYYLAGFWGCWFLLRSVVGVSQSAALSGSVLFLTNGFFFAKIAAGHFSFIGFTLIPGVLALVYSAAFHDVRSRASLMKLISAALLASSMVYSGGYFVTVALVLTFVVSAFAMRRVSISHFLLFGVLCVCLVAAKVVAFLHFSPVVYHDYALTQANGFLAALGAGLSNLFVPPMWQPPGEFKWWEVSSFVNPVCVIPLLLPKTRPPLQPGATRASPTRFLLAAFVVVLVAGAYEGAIEWLHAMPVLGRLWVLPRYASVLVLPLVVVYALAWDRVDWGRAGQRVLRLGVSGRASLELPGEDGETEPNEREVSSAIATFFAGFMSLVFVVSFYAVYRPVIGQEDPQEHGISYPIGEYASVKYPLPRVEQLVLDGRPRLLRGEVSMFCYDPSFGYFQEGIGSRLVVGSPLARLDETLNFNNPACIVYGDENHCRAWDRVAASDTSNLELLLDNRPTDWKQPSLQTFANWLSFSTLLAMIGFVATSWVQVASGNERGSEGN